MELVDYNTEQSLSLTMYSDAGQSLPGLVAADVSCYYRKSGDAAWTTKVLSAANWQEVAGGVYYITFTAGEMDTYGNFLFFVRYDATGDYSANTMLVTDYATEAALLQSIYDLMATKVNKNDIIDRERDLDLIVAALAKASEQTGDDLTEIYNEIAALSKRIADLP